VDPKTAGFGVTDGDIRRALLRGLTLDAPISEALAIKSLMPNAQAVSAPVGTDRKQLLRLMQERSVRQIPLLDARGRWPT